MFPQLDHYPANPNYGSGTYRRRIVCRASPGGAWAHLFDDFHEMTFDLRVSGGFVSEVSGTMQRFPKTSCPGALASLEQITGAPIENGARTAAGRLHHPSQCTHLAHLACLLISMLGRGGAEHIFEIAVGDPDERNRQSLTIECDGLPVLAWLFENFRLVEPEVYAGRALHGGFGNWIAKTFEGLEADLWRIGQMAVFVARGRARIVDGAEPRRVGDEPERENACFSYTRPAFPNARDNQGFVFDLSSGLPPFGELARYQLKEETCHTQRQ